MKKTQAAVNDFLSHCQFEKNLNPKTLKAYRTDLIQFLNFISANNYPDILDKLDKDILKCYLKWLAQFKPKTVKRKIAALRVFLNEMELEEAILINPLRKIRIRIKEPQLLPTVMNTYEIGKILSAVWKAKKSSQFDKKIYFQLVRNVAVIELLFATGIRVSELCNLRIDQIDLKTGTVKIYGKGNKERMVQVCNRETLESLNEYYTIFKDKIVAKQFFFINRISRRLSEDSVRLMVRKIVVETGLSKKITPHTFRHSFATLLLEESVDIKYIQHLLGHSSITTTQIYTHVNMDKTKKILSMKHPREQFHFV